MSVEILIVSRTHMWVHACVGALTLEKGRALRLFDKTGEYPLPDKYRVGQRWEVTLKRRRKTIPPHIEDVLIMEETYLGTRKNLRATILGLVTPWSGPIIETYEGTLTDTGRNYYLYEESSIPSCSTGFWISNERLKFGEGKYRSRDGHTIAYVGLDPPVPVIEPDTLVRLSLAGWWNPDGISKDRCYLQISGSFG